MQRLSRVILCFIVLTLLLMLIPASSAQDVETFGLSQADFDLLTQGNVVTGTITGAQADFTLDLALSGDPSSSGTVNLSGSLQFDPEGFQGSVDGNASFSGQNTPLRAELRLVDEVIYWNYTDPTTNQQSGWQGMTAEDIASSLSSLGSSFGSTAPVPVDPSQLSPDSMTSNPAFGAMMAALSEINPADFVSMSRLGDEAINGANTAHFQVDLDIQGFVSSEEFTQFLAAAAEASGEMSGTGDISSQQMAMMGTMMSTMFQNSSFTIDEWIGLDDSLLHRVAVDLNMNIDPSAMGETGTPVNFAFNFDVTLSRFNESFGVVAPEGAQMLSGTGTGIGTGTGTGTGTSTAGGAIVAGVPQTVQLQGTGPVELTYVAAGSETITVIAHGIGDFDSTVEILDANGAQLDFNDDHDTSLPNLGARDAVVENLVLPGAGSYTIRVNSFSGAAVGSIEVTVQGGGASTTGGTTGGKGGAELLNQTVQLTSGGAPVRLSFASTGEPVDIVVHSADGAVDTTLTVLDAGGSQIASNDDHGTTLPNLNTYDSAVQNLSLPAGNITLEIDSFASSDTGSVVVTVTTTGGGGGTVSANAEVITGNLAANQRYSQTVAFNAGETVTITVRDTSGTLDPKVTLLSGSTIVAENDDHGTNDPTLDSFDARISNQTIATSGTYVIEVTDYFGSSGSFELTIERR